MKPFNLKSILTLIPILTAGLYVIGWYYYQSYISTFGLAVSQFPISTNDNLINGTFAVILMGLKSINAIAIIVWSFLALFFLLILFYVSSYWVTFTEWLKNLIYKLPTVNREPPEKLLGFSQKLINSIAIYTLLICFLAAIILIPSHLGYKEALKKMESYPNTKLAYLDLGDQVYQAMPIQCSQTHCAYWLGEKAVILKHSDVKQHFAYPKPNVAK